MNHFEFNLLFFSSCRFELDEEMYIACAILNESLYDTHADKRKVVSNDEDNR